VLVVVVIILVGAGSDSKATTRRRPPPRRRKEPFLAGVPQHGTLGAAGTGDADGLRGPQCPFCRDWALGTLPSVVANYVRPGRLKLVYNGVQIIGPNSQAGLRAIYAAGRQNKLWNFTDALYRRQGAENSGWITDAVISESAASVGANGAAIRAAAPTPAVTAQLIAAARQASVDRVQGTPTFVLQRPPSLPQQLNVTALDPATFESTLAAALQ
jgi:protein-disulfide isomerase